MDQRCNQGGRGRKTASGVILDISFGISNLNYPVINVHSIASYCHLDGLWGNGGLKMALLSRGPEIQNVRVSGHEQVNNEVASPIQPRWPWLSWCTSPKSSDIDKHSEPYTHYGHFRDSRLFGDILMAMSIILKVSIKFDLIWYQIWQVWITGQTSLFGEANGRPGLDLFHGGRYCHNACIPSTSGVWDRHHQFNHRPRGHTFHLIRASALQCCYLSS